MKNHYLILLNNLEKDDDFVSSIISFIIDKGHVAMIPIDKNDIELRDYDVSDMLEEADSVCVLKKYEGELVDDVISSVTDEAEELGIPVSTLVSSSSLVGDDGSKEYKDEM